MVKDSGGSSATAKSVNVGSSEGGEGTMVVSSADAGDSDTMKQQKKQQIDNYHPAYADHIRKKQRI